MSALFSLIISLFFNPANDTSDPVIVQLASDEIVTFNAWMLKLDNNQLYTFGETGRLEIPKPEDSTSFEILDKNQKVRFLGIWAQYDERSNITIELGADNSLNLRQVVSASRLRQDAFNIASEIEVIRPEDQPERGTSQTSDWLKEQAEVMLQKTNLGGGAPIMRGMSGNRVLLMVDGFRLNNATFRLGLNQYLNTVPASNLEQIEVMGGPTGVEYGSDGLGGTIHLRSMDPASMDTRQLGYHGTISSADGTQTHQVSGHGGFGKVALQGHFKFNRYQDLEAANPVGVQVPTGYHSVDGSLNLTFQTDGDSRIRLINNVSRARHVPRTDRIQSGRDLLWEYHPQNLYLHGLRFESRPHKKFADYYDLGVGYLRQEEGNLRISANSPQTFTATDTSVETLQYNGTFTLLTDHYQFVYGFDIQSDNLSASGLNRNLIDSTTQRTDGKFPNDSAYNSYGLFMVVDRALSNKLHLKAGARTTSTSLKGTLAEPIGKVDETYTQFTPSLSLARQTDRVFISAGISQGFRAPNLEDALSLGPSNKGFDAPNPDLEPEELWSYDLTFRLRGENRSLGLSAYTSRYQSLIERVPGSYQGADTIDGEPVFILDNVGKAQIDGLSLQVKQELGKYSSLQADAAYTYGTQTEQNVPMTRIAPLRGNLSWLFHYNELRLNTTFSWANRQDRLSPGDLDDSRIPEGGTPGYQVVHVRGHYQFTESLSMNLAVENLTDKLYKTHGSGIYEPGRRALFELDFRWK